MIRRRKSTGTRMCSESKFLCLGTMKIIGFELVVLTKTRLPNTGVFFYYYLFDELVFYSVSDVEKSGKCYRILSRANYLNRRLTQNCQRF